MDKNFKGKLTFDVNQFKEILHIGDVINISNISFNIEQDTITILLKSEDETDLTSPHSPKSLSNDVTQVYLENIEGI